MQGREQQPLVQEICEAFGMEFRGQRPDTGTVGYKHAFERSTLEVTYPGHDRLAIEFAGTPDGAVVAAALGDRPIPLGEMRAQTDSLGDIYTAAQAVSRNLKEGLELGPDGLLLRWQEIYRKDTQGSHVYQTLTSLADQVEATVALEWLGDGPMQLRVAAMMRFQEAAPPPSDSVVNATAAAFEAFRPYYV